jgi:Brp/Blh family beta-carotene 15,15'-monooxygenase
VNAGAPELALLGVAVFVLGTPHGALDARLARDWLCPFLGRQWALTFVAAYLALAGLTLALWFIIPALALAAFLLFAAIHFGHHDSPSGRWVPVLVRGSLAPVLASAAHANELGAIFTLLAGESGKPMVASLGGPLLLLWLAGAAWTLATEGRRTELLALAALFVVAPPLIAFSLYFALVHSPRALASSRRPGERWGDLIRAALPWSLAAVALALALWAWFAPLLGEGPAFIRTTFWWLSALTVPHMALHLTAPRSSPTAAARSWPGSPSPAAAG